VEQNVWLTVRGEQYFEGAPPGESELTTEGTLEMTADGLRLSYEETELTGLEGTTTTFDVAPDHVILTRTGSLNSQMHFSVGRLHTSLYETPFGALTVDVRTESLRSTLTERGGELEIRYEIALEHRVLGKNAFHIKVRKK